MKRKYKNFLVPDDESEPFTKSECECEFCLAMEKSGVEWCNFVCRTNLQKRIAEVVDKLEKKHKK